MSKFQKIDDVIDKLSSCIVMESSDLHRKYCNNELCTVFFFQRSVLCSWSVQGHLSAGAVLRVGMGVGYVAGVGASELF